MKKFKLLIFIFLGFAIACTGPDESPKALVNVFLIDAPAQWDSVVVELQGVELEFVPNGREGQVEKVFLPYELADKFVDLSQLVGGVVLPVGRTEINLGNITGAFLKLGPTNTLYQGDKGYPLTLPNGESDYFGKLQIDLQSGVSYDLIVDFDLEKSIRQTSSSPIKFDFNPSISIYSGIGKGDVQGTISPSSLSPAIYLIQGTDSISTHTNTSGTFRFRTEPGNYTIFIDPKNSSYRTDTLLNVEIQEGKLNSLSPITLSKK
ncbi:uncharacterized protein DUF4382 [Algoriphagus boseongensis]|uniref:Uncharacterized protein DUF4382 n=1 Tax=Algoriphagus boseongensis TaxID=1442587 RepID=A0A4R6T871_9BACT|nr:DUF4382 domain-containing protein [Algoriphagus boseongensis]TDQ17148.1 uncharacterized protein DUF4382 [Algoriphagus boseongensis]